MRLFNTTCLLWMFMLSLNSIGFAAESDDLKLWEHLDVFKQQFTDDLPQMRERQLIRALVVQSRTGFFINKGKIQGLQAAYLKNYEKFINKNIKKATNKIHIVYIPVPFNQLIPALMAGKGDIAAAMLTITAIREAQVSFATGGKMRVNELVITHKKGVHLDSLRDLSGKTVLVVKGSSYDEHLHTLNQRLAAQDLPPIKIKQAADYLSSEDILEMVNAGIVEITVVDDYLASLWAKVLPDINVRQDLVINEDGKLGWAVRKNSPVLQTSLNQFAQTVKKGTLLGNLLFNKFYKNTRWIKNPGVASERKKFGRFVDLFKKYGKQYDFDYYALVAQAFQESGLNQKLRSHRGAIGIMQLLPSTAADRHVNIPDIEKLENNIHAGAKYMHFLRSYFFNDPAISPFDQIAFSWAAYNAGPGNVKKMRRLAEKMQLDKNKWFGNVETAAGRIIGTETVRYVSNIAKYYQAYLLLDEADNLKRTHTAK